MKKVFLLITGIMLCLVFSLQAQTSNPTAQPNSLGGFFLDENEPLNETYDIMWDAGFYQYADVTEMEAFLEENIDYIDIEINENNQTATLTLDLDHPDTNGWTFQDWYDNVKNIKE